MFWHATARWVGAGGSKMDTCASVDVSGVGHVCVCVCEEGTEIRAVVSHCSLIVVCTWYGWREGIPLAAGHDSQSDCSKKPGSRV